MDFKVFVILMATGFLEDGHSRVEARDNKNVHYEVDMPITRDFLMNFNLQNIDENDNCKEYPFGKRCKRKAKTLPQGNIKPKRVRLNISYDSPGDYEYVEKDKDRNEYEEVDLENTYEEMEHETHWDNADVESPKLKSLNNQLENLRSQVIRSRINLLPFLRNIENFDINTENQRMRKKLKSIRNKEHVEDYDDDIPHIYKGIFDSHDSNFEHDILNVFVAPTTTQRIQPDVPQRKRQRKERRRHSNHPNHPIRPGNLNHPFPNLPNYPNHPNHPKVLQRPKLFRDIARLEAVNPTSPFGTITYDDDIPNIYKAKRMQMNHGVNALRHRYRHPKVDQTYTDEQNQDYKNYQDMGDAVNVNPPMDYPDENFASGEEPKHESQTRMFDEKHQRSPIGNDDSRYGIVMTDNHFEQLDQIVKRMKNADSDHKKHKKRKDYDRQDWRRRIKRQFLGNEEDDLKRMEEFRSTYADKSTYTEIRLRPNGDLTYAFDPPSMMYTGKLNKLKLITEKHKRGKFVVILAPDNEDRWHFINKYAYYYQRNVDGSILFINCRSDVSINKDFVTIIHTLRLKNYSNSTFQTTFEYFKNRKALFVFENAVPHNLVFSYLEMNRPSFVTGQIKILITSSFLNWDKNFYDLIQLGDNSRLKREIVTRENGYYDEISVGHLTGDRSAPPKDLDHFIDDGNFNSDNSPTHMPNMTCVIM